MSEGDRRGLLNYAAFLLVVVISIVLNTPLGILKDWLLIVPMVLVLFGVWMFILAGMRTRNPEQFERVPFSTFSWGLILMALGGAWLMYGYNYGWLYPLLLVVVVIAVLAIVAALRRH